ncbi:MAG TPA: hypothetical protein VGM04_07520 [Sphingomicrobium sp.]|jgi:hypothetical protein
MNNQESLLRAKGRRRVDWRAYRSLALAIIGACLFIGVIVAVIVAISSAPDGWMYKH